MIAGIMFAVTVTVTYVVGRTYMKRAIFALAICYMSIVAIAAGAHMDQDGEVKACNVEFDSDIRIDESRIVISTGSDSLVIKDGHELAVNGDEVELSDEQKRLVGDYASEIRKTVPEIVALALEGVEIGLAAVTEVFYALSENGPPQHLLDEIHSIQEKVTDRMYQDENSVVMKGGELRGLEEAMSDLEPVLESAVSEAVGELIVSVGQSIRDGDKSIADVISGFANRKEQFEADIEARVASKAEALESRADGLCEQVYALQSAESRLHAQVPATRDFDLVRDAGE